MDKRFTVGCDPEFFIKDTKTGKYLSAIGKIPGSKHDPYPLDCGAGLQVDNVALEFSSPVATSGEDLVKKLRETLKEVREYMPDGCTLEAVPSAIFDEDQLLDEGAQEFGCDPDYNAWTLQPNPKPAHPNPSFRSCGAHFHLGFTPGDGNEFLQDPYGKIDAIRTLDATMGVIFTFLDTSPEAVERRKLYGGSGSHRPTDYGVEYRVPSNFWLKSPVLVMLTDSIAQDALKLVREGNHNKLIDSLGPEKIQAVINEGLVTEALEMFEKEIKDCLCKDTLSFLDEVLNKEDGTLKVYNMSQEWD